MKSCANCHVTGIKALDAAEPGSLELPYTQPAKWTPPPDREGWAEGAVGCEVCHGPGRAHVERAKGMGADAFGYTAELRIDRGLAQLLRLRVSQLNNCSYCLNLHYEAARDAGIPRPVIDTLTAWWETDFHDDAAARAALAYTEALTRVADATVAEDFGARHDALAEHFSHEEILEIIGIVINMNVWTRLKLAEGACPGLAEQAMS